MKVPALVMRTIGGPRNTRTTRNMTAPELRQFAEATPFVPFRLNLADGRKLEIRHPEFIHVFTKAPRAIVEGESGTWELVNLSIVVSVESLAGAGS